MADPFFTKEDRVYIHQEIEKILDESLSMGPNVQAFEEAFAKMTGVRHAIAMNSCTSALEAALMGLGIKQKDEVIVPCETFIATGMAVHLVGGVPIFAEIGEKTFCLDLDDVKKKLTLHTRGIIIVYMGGLIPCYIKELMDFCNAHCLFLIEDAAHAPGAYRDGKVAGSFGDAGCFSFFPTKVLTAGEGGMLTTDDDRLAEFARSYQHRGRDLTTPMEQYCQPGRNVRMTEMAALLGRIQLKHLPLYLAERRRVVAIYREELRSDERVKLVLPDDERASSHWKIPLILEEGYDRATVINKLHSAGISVDLTYQPPLHLQPVFRDIYGKKEGDLPMSERLLSRHICLPCHPRISDEDALYVTNTLKSILDHKGNPV